MLVAYVVGLTAIAKSEVRPAVVGYWPEALVFLPAACLAILAPVLALVHAAWSAASIRFVYRREGRRSAAGPSARLAGRSSHNAVGVAVDGGHALVAVGALRQDGMLVSVGRKNGAGFKDRLASIYTTLGWDHHRATVVETW